MIRSTGMGIHGRRLAVGLCAVAALAGCSGGAQAPASRIPEFARPGLLAYDDASAGDWIRYRELTRDDFRASEPPDPLGHGAGQIGAATCASIRARPDARISVQRSDEGVVVVPEGLVFEAFLDRDCSWWNDANTALPPGYVLEHEQIHFALFELEARSLTGRASSAARVTAGPPGAGAGRRGARAGGPGGAAAQPRLR